jgi:hypothetical protein
VRMAAPFEAEYSECCMNGQWITHYRQRCPRPHAPRPDTRPEAPTVDPGQIEEDPDVLSEERRGFA